MEYAVKKLKCCFLTQTLNVWKGWELASRSLYAMTGKVSPDCEIATDSVFSTTLQNAAARFIDTDLWDVGFIQQCTKNEEE